MNNRGMASLVLILVGIVVVGGIAFIVAGRFMTDTEMVENDDSSPTPTVTQNSTVTSAPTETSEESEENTLLARLQADTTVETASLVDVTGSGGSGTAYLLRTDTSLSHVVTAQLDAPDSGSVYEGWLVRNASAGEFFSTGVMELNSDGLYVLEFEADQSYEGYNNVVITVETVVDDKPEDHVLEGAF